MKKTLFYLPLFILFFTGCGLKIGQAPRNFKEAVQYGFSDRTFAIPDTIMYGFHWGMTKADVENHLQVLRKEGTAYKSGRQYCIPYNINDASKDNLARRKGTFTLDFEYYKDTLYTVMFYHNDYWSWVLDFADVASPWFLKRHYFFEYNIDGMNNEERRRMNLLLTEHEDDSIYQFANNMTLAMIEHSTYGELQLIFYNLPRHYEKAKATGRVK